MNPVLTLASLVVLFWFLFRLWDYIQNKLFLRKIRKMLDEDDKMLAEARKKGLIP